MKHTEGKVEVAGNWIGNPKESHPILLANTQHPDFQANAARIACLWNAMDGLSNEQVEKLRPYLSAIAEWAGNLPDEFYLKECGPKDGAMRGNLIVGMRSIAKEAIKPTVTP